MSENKQVTIPRHSFFYPVFFESHKNIMMNLMELSFTNLTNGYVSLNVFYSSYSYYLKENDEDSYIRQLLIDKQESLNSDDKYISLKFKVSGSGLTSLTFDELKQLNLLFHKHLTNMLEVLELFTYRFAPSDLIPNLSDAHTEYDRTIGFVVYDEFYKSIFGLQRIIYEKLSDFDILEFRNVFQLSMLYFYGYSYYLQKHTIKEIKEDLDKLFSYYNDEDFLRCYFNLLNGKINKELIKTIRTYKKNLFDLSLSIFEKINGDFPKNNLMPRKKEKILLDDTLI